MLIKGNSMDIEPFCIVDKIGIAVIFAILIVEFFMIVTC